MPWERRYFKGEEVWVEVDASGDPIVDNGRVRMKYQNEPDAKIYNPRRENVSGSPESDRDRWTERLEKREKELDERANALRAREQALDEREAALDAWEKRLKHEGILEAGTEYGPDNKPDFLDHMEPPESGVFEFYTDGACSGNPGPCGYGVVARHEDDYDEWNEFLGEGTNNIAELRAIQAALESVEDRSEPVRILSDSRYAIGVLTKGWKAKANRQLIEDIRELLDEFDDVEIMKVEGHAGEPLNERADDLARDAIPNS